MPKKVKIPERAQVLDFTAVRKQSQVQGEPDFIELVAHYVVVESLPSGNKVQSFERLTLADSQLPPNVQAALVTLLTHLNAVGTREFVSD